MNESRYILPPTQLSKFVVSDFIDCTLTPYQSAMVKDEHFVKVQTIFTGT